MKPGTNIVFSLDNPHIRLLLADRTGSVIFSRCAREKKGCFLVNLITLDSRSFQFLFYGITFLYDMNIGVTGYIPEETTKISDGETYTGSIREDIHPIGGNNTLVVIDGGQSGLKVISIHQSQIIHLTRNFPVGSEVVFYWSQRDDQYSFRKPGAPYA